MPGRITVKIDPRHFDPQAVIDEVLKLAQRNFDSRVGPHFVSVARGRVPVGKERRFNPRQSSFRNLSLKPLGSLGNLEDNKTLAELHGLSAAERASFFQKAFGDQTDNKQAVKFFQGTGPNKGKTPNRLRASRGTIKGAFRHLPGTLRDSIVYEGSRREGHRLIGVASANTAYAAAIHDGFTHKGGSTHKGASTKIPGTPYMTSSLANVRSDVLDADNYKG